MPATAQRFGRGLFALAFALALVHGERANAQVNVTWGNAGTDWTVPANWVGGVLPGPADSGFFTPNPNPLGISFNPFIPASTTQQLQSMLIANGPLFTNYTITGGSSSGLTLSSNVANGTLTTRGVGNTIFDGPVINGNATVLFNVGTGSALTLTGASVLGTNTGTITAAGGRVALDSSSNTRISNTNNVSLVGGTLALTGSGSGGTTNGGAVTSNGGFNTISVEGNNTLNFTNTGSLRGQTFMVFRFEGIGGALGTAGGPRITFTGPITLGNNGLIANSTGVTYGFGIVNDSNGVNFATWNSTNGIIAASPTQTGTTAANLQTYAATDRVQFNPATGTTTASGNITNGTIRISPAVGATLALGANNLVTSAIMLDGANDFAITGTGTFGAATTRYVHVNDPNSTLTISNYVMMSGTNPTVFAGPGFVVFGGNTSQNTLTTSSRFSVVGGTLRASDAQIGLTGSGAGTIYIGGGVIEIQGGTNGTGASADFRRGLGTTAAGQVAWDTGSANGVGRASGGFSAFGSNASVNIGGVATPANLQWGQASFVQDGYALIFGSTKSNALLTFLNPLQLDNGATPYQAREIRVIEGSGGDGTVMAGTISGAANADLIKTGFGSLILPTGTTHTYQGTTFIPEGTLQVDGTINAAANPVIVGIQAKTRAGTLAGIGTVNRKVHIQPTGTLSPGTISPVRNPGVLTVNGNITAFGPGATMDFQIQSGTTPGNGPGFHSQLIVPGANSIDLGNASLNLDFNNAAYTPLLTDRIVLVDYSSGPGTLTGTFSGLPDGSLAVSDVLGSGLNYFIFYGTLPGFANRVVLAPVPEPLHILVVGAAGVMGYRWIRRRKAKA